MKTKTSTFTAVLVVACIALGLQTGLAQTRDVEPEILIGVDGVPSIGANNARVTMIEFSDYECPLSSEYFNWTMRDIVKDYVNTGKVKYVYRDFPIESIHPLALKAAEGARCAGEQGKYWEMHDRFFRNQRSIEPKILPLHAQMLGLDVSKFQQCLDSGTYTAKVRDSVAEGEKAGVRGTPSFFLGLTNPSEPKLRALIYIEGRQHYELFKAAIDKLLSTPALVTSP